ncbi:hypothetical protein J4418_03420 [Candidatus Woesearchaeota archaeon]|nr:hypothetical protein [Candidatus Woesearchaeota archaeon]
MGRKKGVIRESYIEFPSSAIPYSRKLAIDIPVSLFCDRTLSIFEVLIEFLKDTQNLSYHEIAVLTNRNDRTIWTIYNRASKKRKGYPKPDLIFSEVTVPLSIFLDRKVAVLEAVVLYLKERGGYSFKQIGDLLRRSDRTIWTVYSRAKRKTEGLRAEAKASREKLNNDKN